MKESLKSFFVSVTLLFFLAFAGTILAQEPPHPPSEKGSGTNQAPAGVPVGNGLYVLLVLGVAYGGLKFYQIHNRFSVAE